ncbi:MAG: hypothetical protein JNK04_04935 [Myxococcales bacterium]|nr:hypothetical protein [Myxococcales bacterium]
MRPAWLVLAVGLTSACGDSTSAGGSGVGGSAAGGNGSGAGSAGGGDAGGAGEGGGAAETALVHRVGRFDLTDPEAPTFSWSGSSLQTRVEGSGVSIVLDGASAIGFQVMVDGALTSTFETTGGLGTYELAAGLPSGPHDVRVIRRNEGFFGDVAFHGFEAAPGASLVESPVPRSRAIEIIGDSITCGYGVEGPDEFCNFSGDTETVVATYGFIAAENVEANAHFIAFSGKGVHQNYGGDLNEPMPELYLRTLTGDASKLWDFSSYTPDAVIINLGTNDFSAAIDGAAFTADYVELLGTVRGYYPAAKIVAVTWAHWGASNEDLVHDAVATFADPDVVETQFSIDPADGWGCDYHPSATTHQKLGAQLTTLLETELGW